MDFAVKGTVLPVLEATLEQGEGLISTHGDLGWMSPTIQLSQTTGGKGFMKAAKARALLEGRHEVTKDDIHFLSRPILSHRLSVRATGGIGVHGIIDGIIASHY